VHGGELELCCRRVLKPVRYDVGCCIVNHPIYIYIEDKSKSLIIDKFLSWTGHSFLMPSSEMNVFLGTPTPRRCSVFDFCRCVTLAGVDNVDFEVYGQKASPDSYHWLSDLPPLSRTTIDVGRYCIQFVTK
jgi:hypothetical protein